jgi:hypothetical protein
MYSTHVQEVSGFFPTNVLNLKFYSQTFEMLQCLCSEQIHTTTVYTLYTQRLFSNAFSAKNEIKTKNPHRTLRKKTNVTNLAPPYFSLICRLFLKNQ